MGYGDFEKDLKLMFWIAIGAIAGWFFGIFLGIFYGVLFLTGEGQSWSGISIGLPLAFILAPLGAWFGYKRPFNRRGW
jgi:hypothetical protein